MKQRTKLLTYDPAKDKQVLVGWVDEDTKTLYRIVEAKHFMRVLNGYGIQEIAFQEAVEAGVKKIIQQVKATNDDWIGTIKDWKENSSVQDYGHGKQRFLSLKYMKKVQRVQKDDEVSVDYNARLRLKEEWEKIKKEKGIK